MNNSAINNLTGIVVSEPFFDSQNNTRVQIQLATIKEIKSIKLSNLVHNDALTQRGMQLDIHQFMTL